jgi:hypothetical protein
MLRREEMLAAVQVGAELDTIIRHFAQLRKTEDLKAARVSQHGARPADEFVQPAKRAHKLVAGAEVKMVRVAENNLRAKLFENCLRNSFDAARRADRHKDRGLDGLMGKREFGAAAARTGCIQKIEFEAHSKILAG